MLSFFPRDVLDEILNLIESVSEGFPSYSFNWLSLVMSLTASFVMSLFLPRVLDEIWDLIESVSIFIPTYSSVLIIRQPTWHA